MKTNHINHPLGGRVYCYRINKVADLTTEFMQHECMNCPYYAGTDQGRGVECLFDDACTERDIRFETPSESEEHSMMQYVRLGMKGYTEVRNSLQTQQPGGEDFPSTETAKDNPVKSSDEII